jgi:hypothetical protein
MPPTVVILGRPNVGKSTLFNRLAGRRIAIVDNTPGVTRDRKEAPARIGGREVLLVDTAGLEEAAPETIQGRMRASSEEALRRADVALFVVDARGGLTPPTAPSRVAAAAERAGDPGGQQDGGAPGRLLGDGGLRARARRPDRRFGRARRRHRRAARRGARAPAGGGGGGRGRPRPAAAPRHHRAAQRGQVHPAERPAGRGADDHRAGAGPDARRRGGGVARRDGRARAAGGHGRAAAAGARHGGSGEDVGRRLHRRAEGVRGGGAGAGRACSAWTSRICAWRGWRSAKGARW